MLKQLSNYFDHYTINTRFMPVFFVLLPFALSMLAWCPDAKTIAGGSLTIAISFGVMTLLSTLISNIGNRCQRKLFVYWGAAPTTLILRHSNRIIDKHTKQRYHLWISGRVKGLEMPSPSEETRDSSDADLKYESATNYLREYTRDKNKFPSVYRDNVAFGFSRNLFAIRHLGLTVALLSVLINIVMIWTTLTFNASAGFTTVLSDNSLGTGASLVSFVLFLIFLLSVNERFVKERGLRYAKSLFESCEIN